MPIRVEVKQRRQELLLREVARGAKHDEGQALPPDPDVRRERHGPRMASGQAPLKWRSGLQVY
jgi:hypothetical protein